MKEKTYIIIGKGKENEHMKNLYAFIINNVISKRDAFFKAKNYIQDKLDNKVYIRFNGGSSVKTLLGETKLNKDDINSLVEKYFFDKPAEFNLTKVILS